jgi:hypothetical protein
LVYRTSPPKNLGTPGPPKLLSLTTDQEVGVRVPPGVLLNPLWHNGFIAWLMEPSDAWEPFPDETTSIRQITFASDTHDMGASPLICVAHSGCRMLRLPGHSRLSPSCPASGF